ncbi:hypothetical protein CAPTEDRAFT_217623, partial [Capitella teleta]
MDLPKFLEEIAGTLLATAEYIRRIGSQHMQQWQPWLLQHQHMQQWQPWLLQHQHMQQWQPWLLQHQRMQKWQQWLLQHQHMQQWQPWLLQHQNRVQIGNHIVSLPVEVYNLIKFKKVVYIPEVSTEQDCIWNCLEKALQDGRSSAQLKDVFKAFILDKDIEAKEAEDAPEQRKSFFKALRNFSTAIVEVKLKAIIDETSYEQWVIGNPVTQEEVDPARRKGQGTTYLAPPLEMLSFIFRACPNKDYLSQA